MRFLHAADWHLGRYLHDSAQRIGFGGRIPEKERLDTQALERDAEVMLDGRRSRPSHGGGSSGGGLMLAIIEESALRGTSHPEARVPLSTLTRYTESSLLFSGRRLMRSGPIHARNYKRKRQCRTPAH